LHLVIIHQKVTGTLVRLFLSNPSYNSAKFILFYFYRPTVIVGLFLQQAVALFVLKSGAGFSLFNWIATLASDFLNQSAAGATFFFDAETVAKHWFFVNTVCIFLSVSRCQLLTPVTIV
jgi:nucleoside permease NupC